MTTEQFLKRLVWAAGASAVLSLGAAVYLHRGGAEASVPLPVLIQLDGFSLVDQHGKAVTLGDFADQIFVADFIFTSCQSACPMLTSKMHSLQEHLAERERALGRKLPVRLVSFSVDPEVDTPEKLSAYAEKWHADPARWSFLTGSLADVNRAVTRGMKIPFEKGTETSAFDVMHGERFVLVDGKGRIRGYFDADAEGMQHLRDAIETLVHELGGS